MGETATLAEFVAESTLEDVPEPVHEKATEAISDLVGVAVYGSHHEVGGKVAAYVDATFAGAGATVFGRGAASPAGAALANGAFGHAVDFDDTFESIVIHPTSPVFSAALAVAEAEGASGRDVLEAYVTGIEVAFRTGHATYPSHYDHGWHSTGTVGSFGATAAAASVLGLSAERVRHALGIAASASSSLKKNFGTMTKPLHSGHAAQMGVRSALLAAEGFTADPEIFEGKLGYGTVMTPSGEYDPEELTAEFGEEWAVMDLGYKPYPSGVITHAAMDAMREIVVGNDLDPEDVESVTVALDEAASEMLHHERPETGLEAKFSIEFCLAAVLRERDPGVHEFTTEYVTDPVTRTETAKVSRAFEPNLFGGDFANYAARVSVTTREDAEHVVEEKYAPGSPNNPLSEDRLRAKFDECANAVISEEDARTAYEAIRSLEDDGALEELLGAVGGDSAR
jgi:2-methylcitrate dehydratase PrpD